MTNKEIEMRDEFALVFIKRIMEDYAVPFHADIVESMKKVYELADAVMSGRQRAVETVTRDGNELGLPLHPDPHDLSAWVPLQPVRASDPEHPKEFDYPVGSAHRPEFRKDVAATLREHADALEHGERSIKNCSLGDRGIYIDYVEDRPMGQFDANAPEMKLPAEPLPEPEDKPIAKSAYHAGRKRGSRFRGRPMPP